MKALLLVVAFLIGACGNAAPKPYVPTPPVVPPVKGKTVILAVWGAEPCHPCHVILPKVQAELNKLSADQLEKIEFRVYSPVGRGWNDAPTQSSTDAFVKGLGLKGLSIPDPKWKAFKTYLPGSSFSIPAGVVFYAETGQMIRQFWPGQLDPVEIVYAAKNAK